MADAIVANVLIVVVGSYLLAGLVVAPAALLGRLSPMYRFERWVLVRWWSRLALLVVVAACLVRLAA